MPVTIGVDIGGSHISCAALNKVTFEPVAGSLSTGKVNSKASKYSIFRQWSKVINKTLEKVEKEKISGIGIAMPGPFDYGKGIALFKTNDKYEALYNVSVIEELPKFLRNSNLPIRFLNDASSFGIGGALQKKLDSQSRIIALTLGTGFGASFIKELIPINNGDDVPEGGCLWDKNFKGGIADDYFSTRWFINSYSKHSGKPVLTGVKEIVSANDSYTRVVFEEFTQNLGEFLVPYVKKFRPDILLIGGNIAKAHQLFLSKLLEKMALDPAALPVIIIENTEEAGIIGSSYLFQPDFWRKIKKDIPLA